MDLIAAPAIVRVRPKAQWNPSAVDESIRRALWSSRFNAGTMVALHGGEAVALVRGEHTGRAAYFTPITWRQWCGFNAYTDLDAAAKNGQQFHAIFSKPSTLANVSNCWYDAWPTAGTPGAGNYSGVAAQIRKFDNATAGGIQCSITPGAGQTRHLVGWSMGHPNSSGAIVRNYILYDRVAAYDGCTILAGTSTTMDNSTGPAARYVSSGQDGLMTCLTCTTGASGVNSELQSLTITDQLGNVAVETVPTFWPLNWLINSTTPTTTQPSVIVMPQDPTNGWTTSPWMPLPQGVSGVRKIEAYSSTASATLVCSMALIKPLGSLWCGGAGVTTKMELARSMFTLERIYSDACMSMLFSQASNNTTDILADLRMVHG